MSAIDNPDNRTFVYEDSPFQFDDQSGAKKILLIRTWNFTPNISDFDIDRIDTAAPIFTKKSDILGTFSFETVNTVDFFEPGDANNPSTYAFWANQIALGDPPIVTILAKVNAPNAATEPVGTIKFVGRIMSCPFNRPNEEGTHKFTVNGEITEIQDVSRGAT